MSEAYKCDVNGCEEFNEGSPVAKFLMGSVSKALCEKHANHIVDAMFPELKPEPEPEPAEETPAAE